MRKRRSQQSQPRTQPSRKSQSPHHSEASAKPVYTHHTEVMGILIIALSIFLFIGNQYAHSTGIIGRVVFGYLFDIFIGNGKIILPYFVGVTGLLLLFGKEYTRPGSRMPAILYSYWVYLMFLEMEKVGELTSFRVFPLGTHTGGMIGFLGAYVLHRLLGFAGLKIILIVSVFVSLVFIFKVTLLDVIRGIVIGVDAFVRLMMAMVHMFISKHPDEEKPAPEVSRPVKPVVITEVIPEKIKKEPIEKAVISAPVPKPRPVVEKPSDLSRAKPLVDGDEDYILPDLNLLKEVPVPKDFTQKMDEEIKLTTQRLEDALDSFKVNARVVNYSQGPTVTRYELQPGFGVKVSKIVNLSDDIALNLAAKGVRIEAPIPGKSVVGIEIPNHTSFPVSMLPLAKDEKFLRSSSPLLIALGKDLEGKSLYVDLTKMPHLLVAGATGAGKSVCINSIIISLLLRNTKSTVRFILIDPKKVELSFYDEISHLIAPVVTDARQAAVTLKWCVREMEKRYDELQRLGVKNIDSYNEKIGQLMKQRDKMTDEEQKDFFVPRKLEYIVIIIDELADLMMVASSEVESSIARISQMARAVGIHLIIATQRPSVDVITGLIKANIPSRISFAVSSQIDSRTILDGMGAEKLLGKGDMLYKPIGSMQSLRVQGVFISEKEVHDIVNHVRENQGKPAYLEEVVNLKPEDLEDIKNMSSGGGNNDEDEFFNEARDMVVSTQNASISYIQRKLRIGYNRAARIMEQLESAGVVSSPEGEGKTRKVIV